MADSPAVVTVPDGLDDFGAQAFTKTVTLIGERNEKAGVIQAASGDSEGLLEALRKTSPLVTEVNTQIDKLNAALEAAELKRDEILKPEVEKIKADSASQVEPLTAEVDELDKSIRAATNYLKQMYGEDVAKALPHLTSRKGRAANGTGGGTKRVRGFDAYVDGVLATMRDGKGVERSNLAAAARVVNVETTVIQAGFFEAQGTTESDKYKDSVEFTVTGKDDDGKEKSFTIKCVRSTAESTAAVESGEAV